MANMKIKDYASKGGKVRVEKTTTEQRSASASTAAKARWAKYRLKKNHTCDYSCRCICGVPMQKHSKYSVCKDPRCTKII